MPMGCHFPSPDNRKRVARVKDCRFWQARARSALRTIPAVLDHGPMSPFILSVLGRRPEARWWSWVWGPASKNAECRKPRASAQLWGFERGGWLAGAAVLGGSWNA